MIIAQTLEKFFPQLKISTSNKNFNWELGLSLSIFEIEKRNAKIYEFPMTIIKATRKLLFDKKPYDIIVLEYWIDRPKEMDFLLTIAKPDIGVFTAIDSVHSEQFWDPAAIANEEVKMIQNTKELAFLNFNDTYAMQLSSQIEIEQLTYLSQWNSKTPDIYFDNIKIKKSEQTPKSELFLYIKWEKIAVETNLFAKSNYWYIWVALAIAETIDYKLQKNLFGKEKKSDKIKIEKQIQLNYRNQAGRFSIFPGINNSILFDSTYNASPLSMRSIISTVRTIKQELYQENQLWLVLWDMRELGDFSEYEHRLLAGHVGQAADRIFLLWEYMTSATADELKKTWYDQSKIYRFSDNMEIVSIIKKMLANKEFEENAPLILFKGSQNTIFLEEALKELLANPEDAKNLTRQSKQWLKKKK